MKQHMMIGLFVLALLLSSGGAVYYKFRAADYEERWAKATEQLSRKIQPPDRPATPRPIRVSATNNTAKLLEEFDALLLELEQKEREIAELQSATNRTRRARNMFSDEGRQARTEELKQTDPEAYEKMMERREQMRSRIQTAFAERASTLLDRTPSSLTAEEQKERALMLQTLEETWRLSEQLTSPDTPSDERREIRDSLFEKTRELRPLLETERDRQLYELGTASGYSEVEAEAFVDYINETIKATSMPSSGRRGGDSRRR